MNYQLQLRVVILKCNLLTQLHLIVFIFAANIWIRRAGITLEHRTKYHCSSNNCSQREECEHLLSSVPADSTRSRAAIGIKRSFVRDTSIPSQLLHADGVIPDFCYVRYALTVKNHMVNIVCCNRISRRWYRTTWPCLRAMKDRKRGH